MTLGGTIAGVLLAFLQAGHHPAAQEHGPCARVQQGDLSPAPAATAGSACRDLARLARAAEEERARRDAAIAALRAGRCAEGRALAGLSGDIPRRPDRLLLAAEMHMTGICAPRDPRRAAWLLDAALARDPGLPGALALKGVLFWWGQGVLPDHHRARLLFRRAALELAARDLESLDADPARRDLSATHFRTLLLAELGGPWPIAWPRPLERMFTWLGKRHAAGAEGLLTVAKRLRRGAWGLPPDPVLAFAWVERAALLFGTPEAHYAYALALRDPELFRLRARDPRYGAVGGFKVAVGLANVHLVEAARTGYRPAMVTVVRLLQCAPDYPQKTFALHYWASRLVRAGYAPAKALRTRTARELSAAEREDAEHWPNADPPPFTLPFLPRHGRC